MVTRPSTADPEARTSRTFLRVLVNTAVANLTTSYLWWSLIFWAYLETESVLANGLIAGTYMLLVSVFSMWFGTVVDRHRKHRVMLFSGTVTAVAFAAAGLLFWAVGERSMIDLEQPWFWIFSGVLLLGSVVEQLRNIALSTTVTLLVPEDRRANANGLVGTVQGIGFVVTSVLSGLSVGLLGMGWTIVIALVLVAATLLDLLLLTIPEDQPAADPDGHQGAVDLRGGIAAVRAAPGLFALILFSTFNNLLGGAYMALMDPYGIEMFSVEGWGIVFAVASTGFIVGGLVVAKLGLGRNPMRTMLLVATAMGVLGTVFTLREWWWLYALGIWLYMSLFPAVEAAEQTVIQRVVPFATQGRVFGFAMMFETGAAPITAFAIAPIAQFWVIPYMETDAGRNTWGWLLGEGDTRGIALVLVAAGLATIALALGAFLTRSYRLLSAQYLQKGPDDETETVHA